MLVNKFYLACLIIVAISSIGCNKSSPLGSDILPTDDFAIVAFTDEVSIKSSVIEGDSLQVYSPQQAFQLQHHLCGVTDDPVFGKVTSTVYNQFIMSRTDPDFTNIISLDSIVLRIALGVDSSYYSGCIDQPQTFHVYELSESLDRLSNYYSNESFGKKRLIASATVVPDFRTQPIGVRNGDTIRYAPNITFKLDALVSAGILADALNNPSLLETNSDFQDYFKGIAIVPDASNNAMVRFNYESGTTGMIMYYKEQIDTNEVFNRLGFAITSITAKTTHFDHDITGSELEVAINANAADPSEEIYVSGMEGPDAKISFPNAEDLGNIIVNNAVLELTVVPDATDSIKFPIPHLLLATQLIDGFGYSVLVDAVGAGNPFQGFDGSYHYVEEGGVTYRRYILNISKHFQDIVNGTASNDIYISARAGIFNGKPETSNRVVLGGADHPDSNVKAKLKLTYTQL